MSVVRSCDQTLLCCRGRLVFAHGVSVLRTVAHFALLEGPPLALDLTFVTQLDAAGIGVLAEICGRAREVSRPLVLVGASARVPHLLRLTRLDTFFPCKPPFQSTPRTANVNNDWRPMSITFRGVPACGAKLP
jgi:anti-anti-sigma factor